MKLLSILVRTKPGRSTCCHMKQPEVGEFLRLIKRKYIIETIDRACYEAKTVIPLSKVVMGAIYPGEAQNPPRGRRGGISSSVSAIDRRRKKCPGPLCFNLQCPIFDGLVPLKDDFRRVLPLNSPPPENLWALLAENPFNK